MWSTLILRCSPYFITEELISFQERDNFVCGPSFGDKWNIKRQWFFSVFFKFFAFSSRFFLVCNTRIRERNTQWYFSGFASLNGHRWRHWWWISGEQCDITVYSNERILKAMQCNFLIQRYVPSHTIRGVLWFSSSLTSQRAFYRLNSATQCVQISSYKKFQGISLHLKTWFSFFSDILKNFSFSISDIAFYATHFLYFTLGKNSFLTIFSIFIPYPIREKSVAFERAWNWKHVICNREQDVARLPSYFRYAALEACYFFWTGSKPGVLFQRLNRFSIFNQQHSFIRLFDFNIFYIMQIVTFSKFLWFRNWKQLSPTEFIFNFLLSLELFPIPNTFCYVIISLLVWFSWFCRPSFLHADIFRTIGHIQISAFSASTCLFRLPTFQVKTYATRWLWKSGKTYIHTTY